MWKTTYFNFSDFLIEIGVSRHDVLMVHSFLPCLGELQDGIDGIYRALRERVGEGGTLVVPTFTYSFCRGTDFDIRHTPSTVGSFTEFVRSQDGAMRSVDPIFSISAVGKCAWEITRIRAATCFGVGSVFELLEQHGVKFLLVGIDYQQSLTYFVHLEKLFGVPYREDKLFSGRIIDVDGTQREAAFSYCVRSERTNVRMNYNRVGFQFDATPACRQMQFAYGRHRLFNGEGLKAYTFKCLTEDPYCLTTASSEVSAREPLDR